MWTLCLVCMAWWCAVWWCGGVCAVCQVWHAEKNAVCPFKTGVGFIKENTRRVITCPRSSSSNRWILPILRIILCLVMPSFGPHSFGQFLFGPIVAIVVKWGGVWWVGGGWAASARLPAPKFCSLFPSLSLLISLFFFSRVGLLMYVFSLCGPLVECWWCF